ncbi:unnamed protein product, partial [Staurois parvus]
AAVRAVFCTGTRAHSFEWTSVPVTHRERSPCTSFKNAAHTGTLFPSMVAFPSAGGVPLELMAPARRSAFLCAGGAAARIFLRIRSGTTHTDVNLG